MRVLARSLVLALALGAVPLATVAAHECVIANRSETGNANATHSARWITVTLTEIYEHTEEFGLPDLTPDQVTYAVALAQSWGIPDSFTFRSDKTIAGDAAGYLAGDHATDGRGLDHFFTTYGEQLLGALFAALANA
jgi:hypothetical protein